MLNTLSKAPWLTPIRSTKVVALDCEMVELYDGSSGLARVTIINYDGQPLMDTYVNPDKYIVNYRTPYSGVTEDHIADAPSFSDVQLDIFRLLRGKIIIGHSLNSDFRAMHFHSVSSEDIRDISKYPPYQQGNPFAWSG